MSVKHAQLSRGVARVTCGAAIVGLAAFGFAASASAATTSFGPIPGSPVAVGETPIAIAFDQNADPVTKHTKMYVANGDGDSISVIDTVTHLVTATIPLRSGLHQKLSPDGITVNQADDLVFVADFGGDCVDIIDGKTNTVTSIGNVVGASPEGIAWDSANHVVYVANSGDGTVSRLDDKTGGQINPNPTISIGSGSSSEPTGLAVDQLTNKIIVTARGDDTVYSIDGSTNHVDEVTNTFGWNGVSAVAVDSSRGFAYVANSGRNTVSVVNIATNATLPSSPIAVGHRPAGLAVDASSHKIYVSDFLDASVTTIDPASGFASTTVSGAGNNPYGVAVDSESGDVYLTDQSDNDVTIFGTSVSPTITSGAPTDATVGQSYTFPFTAIGTPSDITFSVTGALPNGVTLVNGALVGTPTESGTFAFDLTASNSIRPSATAHYVLTVNAAAVTPTPTPTPTPGTHLPQVAG